MSAYITRKQYEEAMEASDALAIAAVLVLQASKKLDAVSGRFMSRLEAIDGADQISFNLAQSLNSLADQISLEADAAVESRDD